MPLSEIQNVLKTQRAFFDSNATKDVSFRLEMLRKLKKAVQRNEEKIAEALKADLGKSRFESYETEIGLVLTEISCHIRGLKKWSRPKKVRTQLVHFPAKSLIYREPFGLSLIMSPWNFPFLLTFLPLVGSISAGNCCVVKPSRYTAETSRVMEKISREIFGPELVRFFHGGSEMNQALLKEKFDMIFFTGSPSVGKVVMEAAAKNLTPVILELGGKNPVIVDRDANLKLASRRIAWGKFLNAGQTCVGPDYLLVHNSVKKELLERMQARITEFFGEKTDQSEDFSRIVNEKHFERLCGLLKGGKIIAGGGTDRKERYIAPTIVDDVRPDSPLMKEEIFGPILPVIGFDDLEEAIRFVNSRPKPLSLYYFSKNRKNQEKLLKETSSGGCCFNDTVVQFASIYLPFGGVGGSGIGSYHGRNSYEAFSHKRAVMRKSNLIDIPVRYAPGKKKLGILKMFLK